MPVYIALLRGINVGGNNKIPMADLRAGLEAGGFARVRTYIQSGNVVADHRSRSTGTVAAAVRSVISEQFGLDIRVVVVDVAGLSSIVASTPFADEPDPKRVHVFFLPEELDADTVAGLDVLEAAARAKGARDAVVARGPAVYLHTPDGFGTSELAKLLSSRAPGALKAATARNWTTVTTLLAMATEDAPA